MTTCLPARPRACAAARNGAGEIGQAGEVALLQQEREGLLVGQHVLPELGAEAGQSLVDGGEPVLRGLFQRGAGAHESGVVAVEQARLLGVKPERGVPPVEVADSGMELGVEVERVAVAGEQWGDLALDRLERLAGVGAGLTKNRLATLSRSRPLASSATMVLSKVGGAGLPAMASTSPRWAASARSKAGRKCSGCTSAKGGRPKAPVHSASSGFVRAAAEAEDVAVMRSI